RWNAGHIIDVIKYWFEEFVSDKETFHNLAKLTRIQANKEQSRKHGKKRHEDGLFNTPEQRKAASIRMKKLHEEGKMGTPEQRKEISNRMIKMNKERNKNKE
ncbi:MAG: hypothetical protein AABY22_05900, partial [Nanoarchaeota archaeon]